MAIVVVLYEYTDDTAVLAAVRPAHREFLGAQPNLLLSGPTDSDGAVIVFEGEVAEIEALMDKDPFKDAGVIASRTVTAWEVTTGSWKARLGL
jgi:uncharacterized protein YciI